MRTTLLQRLTQPAAPSSSGSDWRPCALVRHDPADFDGQLIATSEEDEVLLIACKGRGGSRFVFPATQAVAAKLKGKQATVSVSVPFWESLGIARDCKEAEIRRVSEEAELESLCLEEVRISVRDSFVSKRDIWQFQLKLLGSAVFQSQQPPHSWMMAKSDVTEVIRVSNRVPLVADFHPACGLVGSATRVRVSSLSSQLILFICVSKEYWQFNAAGVPFYEQALKYISQALFPPKTHSLTLVVTVRLQTPEGRTEDFYDVVFEGNLAKSNPDQLLKYFRKYFLSFPGEINWDEGLGLRGSAPHAFASPYNPLPDRRSCHLRLQEGFVPGYPSQGGWAPVSASRANVMEAINLGLDQFSLIHLDRKPRTTGTKVVVLTAGRGVFRVAAESKLPELTRLRVGLHRKVATVVCLRLPPMHSVPRILMGEEPIESSFISLAFYSDSKPCACEASRFIPSTLARLAEIPAGKPKIQPTPLPFREFPSTGDTSPREAALAAANVVPLQRVAGASASLTLPADIAVADTWIVQGESTALLHELIGMRLSFDLQLLDRDFDFGSKVSRTALRGKDIRNVVMRGMDGIWSLQLLDSGNISVAKLAVPDENAKFIDVPYSYYCRRRFYYRTMVGCNQPDAVTNSDPPPLIANCVHCERIDKYCFVRRRKVLHTTPSVAWNRLDNILTDINPIVPSVVPLAVPVTNYTLNWRSRPAIKTNLYCLIPTDPELSHKEAAASLSKGCAVGADPMTASVSHSSLYDRFLAFLFRLEQLSGVKLTVSLNRKPQVFTGVKIAVAATETTVTTRDWLTIHHDDSFNPPRLFMFSVEWLMCNANYVERLTKALYTASEEQGFALQALPHALIFPPLAPPSLWADESRETSFDRLPLGIRFSFRLPDWVTRQQGLFFQRLLVRLTDSLKMLFVTYTTSPSNLESEDGRGSIYMRSPCWILTSRDGVFLLAVRADKVDWYENYTLTWRPFTPLTKRLGESGYLSGIAKLQEDFFIEVRAILHNTLIECEPQ